MRVDNDGEGGILALMALLGVKKQQRPTIVAVGLFGAALIYGDGAITPAISVLSALEGLNMATPVLQSYVVPAAVVILLALFAIQSQGTAAIGNLFGPVMLVWFLAIAAMVVGNFRHFLRPELFAVVFLLGLLNLLVEYQLSGRKRWLAWAVPLAALWANCHGSFPVALVIVAVFGAGAALERWRAPRAAAAAAAPYAVLGATMALAMLLNPYGWHLFAFAWQIAHWQVLSDFIIEWRSPFSDPFAGNRAFWVYVSYLAGAVALGIVFRRRLTATAVLLFVVFALLAAQRQRHIVLFAYVALYSIAVAIDPAAVRARLGRALVPAGVALLALGIAAVVRYGNMYGAWPHRIASDNFTPPMVEQLAKIEGNVFNSYVLGAQLIHDYYPRLQPMIDSRIDAYGERYFLYTVHLGVNEAALLDFIQRYDVRYFLLTWGEFNYRIGTMPRLREGWRILFADQKAVLLGKMP
jgi:hypothetical protein